MHNLEDVEEKSGMPVLVLTQVQPESGAALVQSRLLHSAVGLQMRMTLVCRQGSSAHHSPRLFRHGGKRR
jgi:hypothetical protein